AIDLAVNVKFRRRRDALTKTSGASVQTNLDEILRAQFTARGRNRLDQEGFARDYDILLNRNRAGDVEAVPYRRG
ncbi:MAG: hypothetical protein MK125_09345, partial [Dehalococcoidia bacterium]|nr:hypothetical protein [Dehalococcoidia bacterium]